MAFSSCLTKGKHLKVYKWCNLPLSWFLVFIFDSIATLHDKLPNWKKIITEEHSQGRNLIHIWRIDSWFWLFLSCAIMCSTLGFYCFWNNDLLLTKIEQLPNHIWPHLKHRRKKTNKNCMTVARYKDLLRKRSKINLDYPSKRWKQLYHMYHIYHI